MRKREKYFQDGVESVCFMSLERYVFEFRAGRINKIKKKENKLRRVPYGVFLSPVTHFPVQLFLKLKYHSN